MGPGGGEGDGEDVVGAVGIGLGDGGDDERLGIGRREEVGRVDDLLNESEEVVGGLRVVAMEDGVGDGDGDGGVGDVSAVLDFGKRDAFDIDEGAREEERRLLVGELVPVARDVADLRNGATDVVDDGVDY